MKTLHDTKGNQFGLVLILAILLFCILGYAFFTNTGDDENTAVNMKKVKKTASGEEAVQNVPTSVDGTVKKNEKGLSSVSGYIVELSTINGLEGKRVKVSFNDVDQLTKTAPSASNEKPKEMQPTFKNYLFYLSDKDTKGANSLKGGEFVTITFQGEPSENDYVVANSVEMGK